MRSTSQLATTPLWQILPESMSFEERIKLTYARCKSVVQHFSLTAEDILNVTPRYWEFHNDPLIVMDVSVATLLTIHFNLCIGTLAMYLDRRPDLKETIDRLLSFEWSGQYCLTELGHGLDVLNMETTARLLPSGEFELDTPVAHAAKFMPPTAPSGIPCVSIVHARLLVEEEDRGPKVFLAKLHDGKGMNQGVISKVLSPRGGARPVKHCLTYFKNVCLPASALLGSLDRPKDPRTAFFSNISRVISGTLSMGAVGISSMRISSYIAAKYSLRRRVVDSYTRQPREIMSFVTQYTPVLTAIAQTLVLAVFAETSREMYVIAEDLASKHFIAAIFKTIVMKLTSTATLTLGIRCGAQGLFEVNQLSVLNADMRGAAIAEGDILGISIRFAMELLLGRLSSPSTPYPSSLLYKHEQDLLMALRTKLASFSNHRSTPAENALLPHCQPLIEAIGFRMAYDAARERRLDPAIVDMFVASAIAADPAWFSEKAKLAREKQVEMEVGAASALLPRLDQLLEMLDVEHYVVAPIVSDEQWERYVESLETHGGVCPGFDTYEYYQ
ncbi:acyl-CoA dehydrogenase NM domain-like protein [Guyanagaster necrorhizus]|uniref:Acyl-CoA dehydrogenase NM domain-like protein n=1 Tax=Guyanagaster necrorhizus TaxID=856835 RepID=A0A9P8AMT6_9AGAR|nr:acyl-CoA dehydrogenase NM domain-like protein [Guyanagaster necrorhizus MCA 3950]KAG7441051.1 acyl-CoA dehydrogenase NM domain-like protein [Guyanagaster necrorhizus MCA 3950]